LRHLARVELGDKKADRSSRGRGKGVLRGGLTVNGGEH